MLRKLASGGWRLCIGRRALHWRLAGLRALAAGQNIGCLLTLAGGKGSGSSDALAGGRLVYPFVCLRGVRTDIGSAIARKRVGVTTDLLQSEAGTHFYVCAPAELAWRDNWPWRCYRSEEGWRQNGHWQLAWRQGDCLAAGGSALAEEQALAA